MGVYRFEDLRVWQAAKRQGDRVGALITRPDFWHDREWSGQMNDGRKYLTVAETAELIELHERITKMLRR